jgi:hypothetical protein
MKFNIETINFTQKDIWIGGEDEFETFYMRGNPLIIDYSLFGPCIKGTRIKSLKERKKYIRDNIDQLLDIIRNTLPFIDPNEFIQKTYIFNKEEQEELVLKNL